MHGSAVSALGGGIVLPSTSELSPLSHPRDCGPTRAKRALFLGLGYFQ